MVSDREFVRRLDRMAELRGRPAHAMSDADYAELARLENWQAHAARHLPRQIAKARHRLARYRAAARRLGLA